MTLPDRQHSGEVESKIGEAVRWYDSDETDGGYGLMTMTPEAGVTDPDSTRFEWITRTSLAIRSAFEEAYTDFVPTERLPAGGMSDSQVEPQR